MQGVSGPGEGGTGRSGSEVEVRPGKARQARQGRQVQGQLDRERGRGQERPGFLPFGKS